MKKKGAKTSKRTLVPSQPPGTPQLLPMPEPPTADPVRSDRVFPGKPLPPIVRVKTFSPSEWEDFIREWAHSLRAKYHTVMRCSGAGDMGRDIVAHTDELSAGKPWDNYQCKHYDHALRPSDIWVELGKLVYYTFLDEFTIPRRYFFVCPHDVGTSVARLLERPSKLREGLIANWDKHCLNGICRDTVELKGKLRTHVNRFPFKIVSLVPVLKVIEEHKATPWFVHRFGGGLPDRPEPTLPPDKWSDEEIPYVSELLRAYSDREGLTVDHDGLRGLPVLERHFKLSRTSFYSAESLKAFSRDHLPENEFVRLQQEIGDGIQETYLGDHDDGYSKVLAVTKAAIDLPITDHALVPVLRPPDRRGICHQLVNEGQLTWVEADG